MDGHLALRVVYDKHRVLRILERDYNIISAKVPKLSYLAVHSIAEVER